MAYGIGQGLQRGMDTIVGVALPMMLQKGMQEHESAELAKQRDQEKERMLIEMAWKGLPLEQALDLIEHGGTGRSASIVPSTQVTEQPALAPNVRLGQTERMLTNPAATGSQRLTMPGVALTPSRPYPGEAEIAQGLEPPGMALAAPAMSSGHLSRPRSARPRRSGLWETMRLSSMGNQFMRRR